MSAQVYGRFGAGEEKGYEPAPAQCTEPRFAAQVPPSKSHLRQECCPPAPEKVLTCAGKAADLFHSGSSSCRFVLLMPLVLSTDDAFCHSGLDPESLSCPWTCRFEDFSTPPAASLEMTKDLSFRPSEVSLSFRPSEAPCHFDRAKSPCPFDRAKPLVISTERSEWRNLFATFLQFFQKKFADMIFVCTFAVY